MTGTRTPEHGHARQGLPESEELIACASSQIHDVVTSMWPYGSARIAAWVPSITNVVARVEVEGTDGAYAKYGFLGMSLVSVLRGRAGSLSEVLAAQAGYVNGAPAMAGEAGALEFLAEVGVRVSRLLGYRRGVLVSQRLVGDTLVERIVGRSVATAELLEETWAALRPLHRPDRRVLATGRAVLVPRGSIQATFDRKLTGDDAEGFIANLGAGWLGRGDRRLVSRSVVSSVAALCKLRSGWEEVPTPGESGVVFGDLKPEHVIFHHGAEPALCDPMLHCAGSVADAAKLISRIVLMLHATNAPVNDAAGIADGIGAFIESRLRQVPGSAQVPWLRDLLVLWAMDALNIVTTHMSAPPELPLAHSWATISLWAPRMIHLVSVLSAHLRLTSPVAALDAAADIVRACA